MASSKGTLKYQILLKSVRVKRKLLSQRLLQNEISERTINLKCPSSRGPIMNVDPAHSPYTTYQQSRLE